MQTEIRAIVAKRRDFEYMLRRHETRKLDFMRYVEHELNLETLRDLRTKRIEGAGYRQSNKKKNKKNGKGAAAASDYSCVRLVRWIFDRAVMKFPGDVDIWLHYIDFAVRQGQSKVGTVFVGEVCLGLEEREGACADEYSSCLISLILSNMMKFFKRYPCQALVFQF